jgi:Zn-dependent membrane protease YugP
MQLKIWINDSNYITYKLSLSASDNASNGLGPEVVDALIAEQKLSDITEAEILELTGQIIDHYDARNAPQAQPVVEEDWREAFRAGRPMP